MSVILDALRKLDREKSSRRKGTANIAAEIVRPDLIHTGRRIPIYVVTVVVAAIAAAAITYGVILKFGFLSKSSPPTNKTVPASGQQASTAASPQSAVASKVSVRPSAIPPATTKPIPPAPSGSAVSSKMLPPAPAEPSAANQQVPPAPLSTKVQDPGERSDRADAKTSVESKSPAVPIADKKQSQDVIPKEVDAAKKKIGEPTPNVSATTPASLKLSAVVWYEDPSRRFAMINGIIATEGSYVEGVKVVEINPTSVRLLHDGQYFEISMSK